MRRIGKLEIQISIVSEAEIACFHDAEPGSLCKVTGRDPQEGCLFVCLSVASHLRTSMIHVRIFESSHNNSHKLLQLVYSESQQHVSVPSHLPTFHGRFLRRHESLPPPTPHSRPVGAGPEEGSTSAKRNYPYPLSASPGNRVPAKADL